MQHPKPSHQLATSSQPGSWFSSASSFCPWLQFGVQFTALCAVTYAGFRIPEIVSHTLIGRKSFPVAPGSLLPLAAFAVALSLAGSAGLRLTAILVGTFATALWLALYAYSGDVLHPSQIFQVGSEHFEVLRVVFSRQIGTLAPEVSMALAGGLVVWFAQNRLMRDHGLRLGRGGEVLLLIVCGFIWLRPILHSDIAVVYPSPQMSAFTGVANAVGVALRLRGNGQGAVAGERSGEIRFVKKTSSILDEPVTVAVIMGESINPSRMGYFNSQLSTTPRLNELGAAGNGFQLFGKTGFSAGIATLASVPNFLSVTDRPIDGSGSGWNLAGIAKKQGFDVALFSTQRVKSLQLASAPASADIVRTEETFTPEEIALQDDVLLKLTENGGLMKKKQFMVLHQRTNHAPYEVNCADRDWSSSPGFKSETNLDPRIATYDRGIRCWDENTTALLQIFAQRRGAVYVFITSDHNELMDEDNQWGHGQPVLKAALVPVMLFTNRPDGEIAQRFRDLVAPSAFEVSALVAKALGATVKVPEYTPSQFYVSDAAPLSTGGTMEVKRLGHDAYDVTYRLGDGTVVRHNVDAIPMLQPAKGLERERPAS